ncbi:hypothetical protein [Mycolicibacter kumamotonensis]|uniref:hypothetical protein n=1 Tax=Mycolicibacter kumamotonensis TaxID=354243 RepID=UPI0013FE04D0|nr:hypothetical protein [Mycolicibacter kumamotonensis]
MSVDDFDVQQVVLHMAFDVINRLLGNPADTKAQAAARQIVRGQFPYNALLRK